MAVATAPEKRKTKKLSGQRSLVDARLREILKRDGTLAVNAVIEEAKSPKSPLHGYFTWDDKVAGVKWREEEARVLIRSFVAESVVDDVTIIYPIWVRDPERDSDEQGYTLTMSIKNDWALALEELKYEIGRAVAVVTRVDQLARLYNMTKKTTPLVKKIKSLQEEVSAL